MIRPLSIMTFLGFALFLAGCAAGPDFHRPSPPDTKAFTETGLARETVSTPGQLGEAQRFRNGMDIPGEWWTLFKCKPLDQLIRKAISDSPTLAAAQAGLRKEKENRLAQLGGLFPSVDAKFSANRSKYTGASFGQPDSAGGLFTLYNASVTVSYTLDIFGATRRGLEELQAQVDYQRYLLEGANLTLTSNIVTAAVQEASLRERIKATNEIIKAEEEQLALVEQKFQLGAAARSDVLAQETTLAQTRASLPSLEKELSQTRNQLALLSGAPPATASELPEFHLSDFQLPADLPVSLPSVLVSQRPDIRASEELLHSACALVGVTTANLYPQLTISGNYGTQSTILTGLFTGGTNVWSIGASLLQPIFRGGELTAKRRAAIAGYEQATAHYRETVLQAFQNVADVLRALEKDAEILRAQKETETVASESLELTRNQYEYGAANYLNLLDAERQFHQARLTLAQAQAARLADTAALFQALGGGWWNKKSGQKTEGN